MKKYVIVKESHGSEAILLSNDIIAHREMAAGKPVVSAGFFRLHIDDEKLIAEAYGESESLGVKSREDDSRQITNLLNGW